jgi:phosphodiesterase/alkaline phosphatase D-like protein
MKVRLALVLGFFILVSAVGVAATAHALTAPSTVAMPSASFGPDNANDAYGSLVINAINLPSAATYLPATNTSPGSDFYFVTCYRTNDAVTFLNSTPETLLSNASSPFISSGNDRGLQYKGFSTQATGGQLFLTIKTAGVQWWQAATSLPIFIRPNKVVCSVGGQIGTQQFMTANDPTGAAYAGSPVVSTTTNMGSTSFYNSAGVFRGQAAIGPIFNQIGGASLATTSTRDGWGGDIGDFAFFWGTFPNSGGTPDASTIVSIANGSLPVSSFPGTCRYHLSMADATSSTLAADPACAITLAASSTGAVTAGSPVRAAPAIALTERGDGYVFRVTPGSSGPTAKGTVFVTGTYANDGGGLPTGIDARIEDANGNAITGCTSSCDWQTIQSSPTGGTFSGSITGVPVGGPYYVAVRYTNSVQRVYHSKQKTYVGLVVMTGGQSQENMLWGGGSGGSNVLTTSGETASVIFIQNLRDSLPPTDTAYGNPALRPLTAASMPGTTNNFVGDGIESMIKTLSTLSGGWPIMVANIAKSGHSIDQFAFDRAAGGPVTLTGSGTSWSGSLIFVPTPPATFVNGTIVSVLAGSVRVTVNGALVAADSNSPGNTGTMVAQNGSGVTGTINYATHAITLTFPSTPPASPVVTWVVSSDTLAGTAAVNNPLTGFTDFGDGATTTSGLASYTWSRVNAPISAFLWMQGTANEGEFGATSTWPTAETSYLTKLNLLKQKLAALPGYDTSTPFVIETHPRAGEGNVSGEFAKKTGIRKGQYDISAPGNSNGYFFGGTYTDDSLISGTGPHEDNTVTGTQRIGRRFGYSVWAAQTNNTNLVRGPEAASANFVAGSGNTQIDVKFNLFGGTSLATGSGASTTLQGFRVGTNYGLYFSDGLNPDTLVYTPSQVFTAALISTSTVRLTKSSGSWATTSATVDYEYGGPFYRFGTALSISAVPGSGGYTNGGPYAITFTGGGCTTEPTGVVSVAGGVLTNAVLQTPGISCTSTPTAPVPAGAGSGTGGSITVNMASPTTDTNDLNTLLYDNRGGFGGNEPGQLALPIYSPMAVAAASAIDTNPPTVSLTAPTNGSTVSGSAVSLTASSSDDVAVAGVTFYANGSVVGVEATSSPYAATWNTTGLANGSYSITAVARDTSNNFATSSPVTVTVSNAGPTISAISSGTPTQTTATLTWTTDQAASSTVLYGSTSAYGTASTSAALVTTHSLSLSGLTPATTYHFQVGGANSAGTVSTSSDQTFVTASIPDTTIPLVSLTAPTPGAIVSGSAVTLSASSTDNVAVAGVTFTVNGVTIGSEATSSSTVFSTVWNTTATSSGSYSIKAISRDTAGNTATSTPVTVTVSNPGPVISGISSGTPGQSSDTITWNTSVPAQDTVSYGGTTGYGTASSSFLYQTTHTIVLSGLTPSTTYHYSIQSTDSLNNISTSTDRTFTTATPPDTTPPTVLITTPTNGTLLTGTAVVITATSSDAVGVVGVTLKLDGTNLTPEITTAPYTYTWDSTTALDGSHTLAAVARDAAGNSATSSVSFTIDNTPPSRTAGTPAGTLALGTTSTTLSLTTNENATCKYSTTPSTLYSAMTSVFGTTGGASHSTPISGLSNGGSYAYYVKCQDGVGNANKNDYAITFSVAQDATAPTVSITAPTTNAVISKSSVAITATANDDVAVVGVQFLLDGAPFGSEQTTAPYSTVLNTTSLVDGTHSLSAVARDGAGNYATSTIVSVRVDNTPPVISSISSGGPLTTSATISWTTNELATTQLNYGLTTSYGTVTALDSTLTSSHTVTLSNLSPSTTYHFQVISSDGQGNMSTSSDQVFSTLGATDVTPPTISAIASAVQSPTSANITWTTDEGATTKVTYGVSSSYTDSTAIDPSLVTSHSVSVSGLAPQTTYHYAVVSNDLAGNVSTSSDQVFTTSSVPVVTSVRTGGSAVHAPPTTTSAPTSVSTNPVTTTSSQTTTSTVTTSINPSTFSTPVAPGASGTEVHTLQVFLNQHGYTIALSGPGSFGNETDYFGLATKSALIKFQSDNGISPTGYLGPITEAKIIALSSEMVPTTVPPVSTPTPATPVSSTGTGTSFSRNLTLGSADVSVRSLQRYLNTNGFIVATLGAGSPGNESTHFGPATKAALVRLQKSIGLPATGYFGPATRAYIQSH